MTPAEEVREAARLARLASLRAGDIHPGSAAINVAMADLLDHIGDDMDNDAMFGNAGSHWTAALALARVINDLPCPMCGRYGCEPKHHEPIVHDTAFGLVQIITDCRVPNNAFYGIHDAFGTHTCTDEKPCDTRP